MRYIECRPLIVDDDENFRLLLCRAFQKANVPESNIQIAGDGIEALRILSNDPSRGAAPPASLVVLDLHLPGMSGLDILAWIRRSSSSCEIPVFMLSSSEDPDHVSRALDLRTDSYFVKPAHFDELRMIVQAMLDHCYSRSQSASQRMV